MIPLDYVHLGILQLGLQRRGAVTLERSGGQPPAEKPRPSLAGAGSTLYRPNDRAAHTAAALIGLEKLK